MPNAAAQRLAALLERFEARDVDGVVAMFAADAVVADPHYPPPIGPAMTGVDAIRAAMTWAFSMIEQPGFAVRHAFEGPGGLAAVEVDTNHRLAGGPVVSFTQVFVAEVADDGRFRRLQSYTPYPPPAPPSP